MAKTIYYQDQYSGHYTEEVFVEQKPEVSQLLDASGKPMQYEKPFKIGFDLRKKQ